MNSYTTAECMCVHIVLCVYLSTGALRWQVWTQWVAGEGQRAPPTPITSAQTLVTATAQEEATHS